MSGQAMWSNASYNTALGAYALYGGSSATNSSSYNVCIGYTTGYRLDTGNYNVFVGNGAGSYTVSGSSNVFIGYSAGSNETNSNKLYIANTNTSSPLIYGEFDNAFVTVHDNLRIDGQKSINLLKTDTNGQISQAALTTDKTWVGNSTNVPEEIDVYILPNDPDNINNVSVLTLADNTSFTIPAKSYPTLIVVETLDTAAGNFSIGTADNLTDIVAQIVLPSTATFTFTTIIATSALLNTVTDVTYYVNKSSAGNVKLHLTYTKWTI